MPSSDYKTVGRGALKLKGVQNSRVEKKKKHKHKHRDADADAEKQDDTKNKDLAIKGHDGDDVHEDEDESVELHKTEAEKQYAEMRRKRLNERVKREGIKTHKERVEELNRYLSNLSEHHDMPRIGPG